MLKNIAKRDQLKCNLFLVSVPKLYRKAFEDVIGVPGDPSDDRLSSHVRRCDMAVFVFERLSGGVEDDHYVAIHVSADIDDSHRPLLP
uniref:Uncharacterized protein n=1 Tax=Angiostrongylus cantonensis TaxID=6313 RepID=A0A0K0CZ77_ANGCA